MNLNYFIRRSMERFLASSHGKMWHDFLNAYLNHRSYVLHIFSDGLPINSKVLDFGCGEGEYLIQLVDYCIYAKKSCYGIGVDISSESLRKAVQNAIRSKFRHQIDFVLADVNYLPFKQETFDGALIMNVLHHLSNFVSIKQLHKIIKKNGTLLIIDLPSANPFKFLGRKIARYIDISVLGYGRSFLFFTPIRLKCAISMVGFKIIKEDHKDFFFRKLLILFLLPPFANFISNKTLMALYRIEEKIEKSGLLNELCSCILLYCIN